MNAKIIKTLVKKEILDVFRDKKTVIMMLVVPVILYPLIFIGAVQLFAAISSGMEKQEYRIAVEADDNGIFFNKLTEKNTEKNTENVKENTAENEEDEKESYLLTIVDVNAMDSVYDYTARLNEEEIDAYVMGKMQNGRMQYEVYYMSSVTNSEYAMNIVMDVFDELKEEMIEEKIKEAGLDVHEILEPVMYEKKDTASNEQSLGNIMGSILPFMLIISLLMGTMYPAIDTTAGERERGTLETILTLPVRNKELITSKFLTVAMIGMLSALFNILSMGGIAFYIYRIMDIQTDAADGAGFGLSGFLPVILVGILAVFAFSLFLSAVTMCVTSFAKSYKEANNYITPLMLVVMLTGYIGFIPNIELTRTMAMIPVANICLLIKNMLVFKIDYMTIAVVLISNVAYAVFAVLTLSRIYDSEAILFGDSKSGLQLFEKRENLKKGGVPTISDVWFVAALTIVLVIYGGTMLQMKFGLVGVFGTQMILLSVPLFIVLYTKKDICLTYGFHKTGAQSYIGGFLMIIGLFCVNIVLSFGLMKLLPESAENVTNTFSEILSGNVFSAFLVIAVAPAICEEMLFRGLMFHSLKARYRIRTAIVIVAILFGIYHMSMIKLITTGLLGLFLCYVVYRTGSIYPAMMMHFVNNAISVATFYYPEQTGRICPALLKDTPELSEILLLLGIGLVLLVVGKVILCRGQMKKNQRS